MLCIGEVKYCFPYYFLEGGDNKLSNISFTDYDRITDNLMYLSNTITLNFHVILSRKSKEGNRVFFQYETCSHSKYRDQDIGRNIKRNMSFYYTIDNKNDFANGLILRPQDVKLLTMLINQQVIPWYFDQRKRLFSIKDDKLIIKGEYKPVIYSQSDYKYISFSPIIYTYEDQTFKEGVRINLNSSSEYADLDIDKFMGFLYILESTDMYAVASNLAVYAKIPPYGINVYSMTGLGGGYVQDNWNSSSETNNNSKKKGNSFLDGLKRKGE